MNEEKYKIKRETLVGIANEIRRLTKTSEPIVGEYLAQMLKSIKENEIALNAYEIEFDPNKIITPEKEKDICQIEYGWFNDLTRIIQQMAGTEMKMTPNNMISTLKKVPFVPSAIIQNILDINQFSLIFNSTGIGQIPFYEIRQIDGIFSDTSRIFNIFQTTAK